MVYRVSKSGQAFVEGNTEVPVERREEGSALKVHYVEQLEEVGDLASRSSYQISWGVGHGGQDEESNHWGANQQEHRLKHTW